MKHHLLFTLSAVSVLVAAGCIIQAPAPQAPPPPGKPAPQYQPKAPQGLPPLADFYTMVSVELLARQLPPGASLGSRGRDSTDPDVHFRWADGNKPGILKNELVDKIRRMMKIKHEKGPHPLAGWYARVCTELAHFARDHGINFGSPAANSTDFGVHERWALGSQGRPKPGVLEQQLVMRINKVFRRYGY